MDEAAVQLLFLIMLVALMMYACPIFLPDGATSVMKALNAIVANAQ